MKELLFILADLWMIFACYYFGWLFIRRYDNWLLGLEYLVVGTSGTNFLLWSLSSASEDNPMYKLAYFFDAFSRSVGITIILVLGPMKVTHRYRPSLAVDLGVFGLATAAGLYLRQFHGQDLNANPTAFNVALFYVVMNLLTAVFLAYFVKRLWDAGARGHAIWTALVSMAATTVAITYDFFPWPFDDAYRTMFYTFALATWGTQAFVFYRAYRALEARNRVSDASRVPMKPIAVS